MKEKIKKILSWISGNYYKIVVLLLLYFIFVSINSLIFSYNRYLIGKQNIDELREERLNSSEVFDRKVKCQDIVDDFKNRYNNVVGGSYNKFSNSCSIKYKSNGEVDNSDMESMADN